MKRTISKATAVFSSVIAGTMLFAGLASAHVSVKPSTSKPKAYESYTIKIPVEKEVPTIKVAVKIPADVDFKNYQPVPGWKVETVKDNAGKITTVTWSVEEGNGIEPGQFQQFNFVAQNPDKEASIAWDAYQYYKDGSIVEWTGDGGEHPHSVTTVSESSDTSAAADSSNDDHAAAGTDSKSGTDTSPPASAGNETAADQTASATVDNGTSTIQTVSIVLSAAALIASLAALWISILFVRRVKR